MEDATGRRRGATRMRLEHALQRFHQTFEQTLGITSERHTEESLRPFGLLLCILLCENGTTFSRVTRIFWKGGNGGCWNNQNDN